MTTKWLFAAALAAGGLPAHAQAPMQPPRPPVERQAAMAADLTLLLGLDARQRTALEAFLATAAPSPPPPPPAAGDAPPPPPPPAGGFLTELAGPPERVSGEQRMAAGRAFWETLGSEQRSRLDALTRLHALPFGPPKGPPSMGRPGKPPLKR